MRRTQFETVDTASTSQPRRVRSSVVTYSVGAAGAPDGHMASTRIESARRLAALMGLTFEGEYDPAHRYAAPPYFVPGDTLTRDRASRLRIRSARDLFGGVVPHPFVATKMITHPLFDVGSPAPAGWCAEFPRLVADVVLNGFSVFTKEDGMRAGDRLLEHGPVRVKRATGIAGVGQFTVCDADELVRALDAIGKEELARFGAVVEQNLTDVKTYSIGQVCVDDLVGAYYGMQHLTTNHHGAEVYGGSELTVVRGEFDALLTLTLADELRHAIAQARSYDDAATRCFDGFFASRRNYDVAQGIDAAGQPRSGVLEQSWRLGGASGAEIGALEAFRADPSLRTVRANAREVYGEAPAMPANAAVYFSGIDPHVGPLTKYAWTEPYGDTR